MNWDSEQECFESFSRELSSFYAVQYDPYLVDSTKSGDEDATSTEDDQVCIYIIMSVKMLYMLIEVTSEKPSMALGY